jgi:hypothetical protein
MRDRQIFSAMPPRGAFLRTRQNGTIDQRLAALIFVKAFCVFAPAI